MQVNATTLPIEYTLHYGGMYNSCDLHTHLHDGGSG
jgi:hypothetical protein